MDIKGKIEEIVQKIKGDEGFAAKFKSDPIAAVESVLGIDLPDDQVKGIIEGAKAKLSIDNAGDALGSLKKLF